MTATFLTLEGTTDGAAITTVGATGADVVVNSSGSMEYDSGIDVSSLGLTRSVRVLPSTTSGANYFQDNFTGTATLSFVGYFVVPTVASAGTPSLIRVDAAGSARSFAVGLDASGHLAILDATGTTIIYTSTAVFPANQLVRVSGYATPGTSTTTGTIRVAAFLGRSTTPISGMDSGVLTGRNLGAANFADIRWGKAATGTYGSVFNMTYLGYDPVGTTFIAPPAPKPTLSHSEGLRYTVNLTGSTNAAGATLATGAALTFAATLVSGPALTFTQPSAGIFHFQQVAAGSGSSVYRFTVTESGQASDPTDITIPAAAAATGSANLTGQTRRRKVVGGVPV